MHYGIVYQRQNQQVQSEIPGAHGFFFLYGKFLPWVLTWTSFWSEGNHRQRGTDTFVIFLLPWLDSLKLWAAISQVNKRYGELHNQGNEQLTNKVLDVQRWTWSYQQNFKANSYLRNTEESQQMISGRQKKAHSRTLLLQRIGNFVIWRAIFLSLLNEKDWA